MKKIYIVPILALGLTIISCSDLTENILNEQDNSSIITDAKNANMLAAPAYAAVRDFMSTGGIWALKIGRAHV